MKSGSRLRELRKTKGFTQLENGTQEMSFTWARTFARVLDCRFVDLLRDEDAAGVLRSEAEALILERYRFADERQRRSLEAVAAALVPLPTDGFGDRPPSNQTAV